MWLRTGEHAREAALNCYAAGVPLFFEEPAQLISALKPLLMSVGTGVSRGMCGIRDLLRVIGCRGVCMCVCVFVESKIPFLTKGFAGNATPVSKQICARLLWHFGECQMLWNALMAAADEHKGAEGGQPSVHTVGLAQLGETGNSCGDGVAALLEGKLGEMAEILEYLLQAMMKELQAILVAGVPSSYHGAGMSRVEVPVSWKWERFAGASMTVDQSGLAIRKTSVNPDYSVALASAGFSSGIHCWVLRIETCQRLVLGVCRGSVDLDRRANTSSDAWAWHSHGTMSGPNQSDLEIGDYTSGDTLSLRLNMERGTLQFFKNGELKGCLSRITGNVFPFVCMDYEGEQVSLLRRYDVVELEEASADGDSSDFASGEMSGECILVAMSWVEAQQSRGIV